MPELECCEAAHTEQRSTSRPGGAGRLSGVAVIAVQMAFNTSCVKKKNNKRKKSEILGH